MIKVKNDEVSNTTDDEAELPTLTTKFIIDLPLENNRHNKTPKYGYSEHTESDAKRGTGVLHPFHYKTRRSLPE
jgi:hypothetical protein